MAVTKQTYTMSAGFNKTSVATALRSALIDAGLMTEWYDSFSVSTDRLFRVLQIQHDSTKTYGTSFYYFVISDTAISVALATNGWKVSGTAPINIPTGTQYLDWHLLPTDITSGVNFRATDLFTYSTTSNLALDRFTSANDTKQSWFVFRQSSTVTRSQPFSFLHKDTTLHPWLDLAKGCISGFSRINAAVSNRVGIVNFRIEENLRRCLSVGPALRGDAAGLGNGTYHAVNFNVYSYFGIGSQSASSSSNWLGTAIGTQLASAVPLPVGRNSANPEYTTDYVPICTNLPWSYYTPTRLAEDFGIYMHYAANDVALGDRFIVQSAINEWEVLNFANNANVTDGASSTFLARIV
jgi:hypothetical protein